MGVPVVDCEELCGEGVGVQRVRRGRAPNCSASGAVVGMALLSAAAAAAVVNTFADRLARWRSERPPGAPSPDTKARARRESDAAGVMWLALPGTAALLLLDGPAAAAIADEDLREIGSGTPAPAGAWSAPLEAHLALGDRCLARCSGCYLDASPSGTDSDLDALLSDVDALAEMGVFEIALGGGETGLQERLFTVAERIRQRGMVPNLTTSGFGLTPDRADRAAALFGQINVSIDGLSDTYRAARGFDGAEIGLRALDTLVARGVRVGVNTVLTAQTAPDLDALGASLAARGASEWQWLRLKPAGRARERYLESRLSPQQALSLWPRALRLEEETGLTLRWDCAMVPFLAAHDLPLEALTRLCVEGCTGGRSLLARNPNASWSPCSFAHEEAEAGEPRDIWSDGRALKTWRARAEAPPEPCASCPARAVCRGGCRIVARHISGDPLAPDPECPKVIACG